MKFLDQVNIYLTPLSPLHIGCGEDFEPTNYVIEDKVLYGFDPSQARLDDNLGKKLGELGDRADLLGIQRFFRDHREHFIPHAQVVLPVAAGLAAEYESRIGKVANREADGRQVFNQLAIEKTIHSHHRPYIPGSSLKGALRTACLDLRNGGRRVTDPDERRKSSALEKRLLGGDFENSPLRFIKPADLLPVSDDMARQVLYAVNRKKDLILDRSTGNERQPRGVTARKDCILGGQYRAFASTLVQHQPGNHTKVQPLDLGEIARATHQYHLARFRSEMEVLDRRSFVDPAWKKAVEALLAGELKPLLQSGKAFLVRLGRYGGAESKTLSGDGVAQIKIMEGKGPDGKQQSSFHSQTKTVWLAAQTEADSKALLPFGWALVEIDPAGDLPQLKAWCEQQNQSQRGEMRRIRQALVDKKQRADIEARQRLAERQAREQAELERQKADAEKAAQRAAMSANQQQVARFADDCQARAEQLRGGRDKPNTQYHARAGALAKEALASPDWSADERRALADAIEAWLPKVVQLEAKEVRKKLPLAALRGQAG